MANFNDSDEISMCLKKVLQNLNITPEIYENTLKNNKGINYTGNIERRCIKGVDRFGKQIKLYVLLKKAIGQLSLRAILSVDRAYQCEMFMYETAFPLFSKIQTEAGVIDQFRSHPKYFTSCNKYLKEIIALEDMIHYKVIDSQSTLTYVQALKLAKEVGKLHAMSFILRKRYSHCFQEICNNIRNESREEDNLNKVQTGVLQICALRISSLFNPVEDKLVYEKFCSALPKSIEKYFDRLYSFDSENKYAVIGHCDLWACNLLFCDQENCPEDICILDWQTVRICSPAIDLTLILFACCDAEVRRKHSKNLTEAYYNSCSQHLRQFGEDINELFPYRILQEHLHEYSGFSLFFALRVIYLMSVVAQDVPDLYLAENYLNAIDMFRFVKLDPKAFNERVKDLIVDYVNFGYEF